MKKTAKDLFMPCTREIDIGDGIVYRPIRSWHSGVYAGEGLRSVNGDGSGCARDAGGLQLTTKPLSYTHRFYWHKDRPEETVSAFLSYPHGMGCCAEYFWEAYIDEDCERLIGDAAESEMEQRVKEVLLRARTTGEGRGDDNTRPERGGGG